MNLINKLNYIFKDKGPLGFLNYLFIRLASRITAIPIVLGIIALSPLIRIRIIKLFSSRIGHYSFNTEAVLCGLDMNLDNDKRHKTFFYVLPGEPICNRQLHNMWKRCLPFIPVSSIAAEVDKLLQRFGSNKHRHDPLKKTFEPGGDGRDRWALLQKINKCHLSFTPNEHKKAKILMAELGIPSNARFVCLLVRDSQYLTSYIPSGNWSYHDYRDADINTYQKAAQFLVDKGYYVIRMGKIVKEPFLSTHPKIIDYATSKFRSDFLDMYLSAHCYFFISTCTGLDSVARTFRKPLLVTNLGLPDFDIWHPWDIFIPKKIVNMHSNTLLTFSEMNNLYQKMSKKTAITQIMRDNALRFVDNSAEEIKDVVEEMLANLEGTGNYSKGDEALQTKFWQIFPKYLVAKDLPVLNLPINEKINMRIGKAFLKTNEALLVSTKEL